MHDTLSGCPPEQVRTASSDCGQPKSAKRGGAALLAAVKRAPRRKQMDVWDRLWKDSMRLTYTSPISEVAEIVDRCLVLGLPWPTRLAGVVEIVCQVCGPQTGVSFYGVVGSAQPLVLLCAAGKPGPVAVTWGAPVAGLAA